MKNKLSERILTSIVWGTITTIVYILFECFSPKLHITIGTTQINRYSSILVSLTILLLILLIISIVRFDLENFVLILIMIICIPTLILFQFFNPYLEVIVGLFSFSLCWYNFLYRKGAILSQVVSGLSMFAPLFCIFKG